MASLADKKKALDWSKRNTQGFEGILDVNQFLPVTGDIQSGIMAGQDLQKGNYGSAALNSLGLLPFIPALGGVIAKNIPSKTTFETAQETAQRNAALPVSEGGLGLPVTNTAMDRAKAMGFDTENPAYHGTNADFSQFDLKKIGSNTDPGIRGHGIYFSKDPKDSAGYGNKIYQTLIKKENPLDLLSFKNKEDLAKYLEMSPDVINDRTINNYRSVSVRPANSRTLSSEAKYKGHDAITHDRETVIFNPENIRSINAAFDPFRRNEPDLLAGVVAAPVGLLAVDKESKKKKNK